MDRRSFISALSAAFAATTLPGCGDDRGQSQDDSAVETTLNQARERLEKHGYPVALDQAIRPTSKGILYLIGDVHTADYRGDVATLLEHLAAHHAIESIGIEGLFGAPRPSILEERYQALAKIIGPESSALIKESEQPLFAPLLPFMNGEVLSNERPVRIFGLEQYEDFMRLEIVSHQLDYLTEILSRLGNAIKADPSIVRGKMGDFLREDVFARQLNNNFNQLVGRVRNDAELASLVIGRVPLYSEDIFQDPEKLAAFLSILTRIREEEAFSARDTIAARQIASHSDPTLGNCVAWMGWYHLSALLKTAQTSALIVHPIRDAKKREEVHNQYAEILKNNGRDIAFSRNP